MHILKYIIPALTLFFASPLPLFAQITDITVQGYGDGFTQKEAVYNALKNVLHQINGTPIAASEDTLLVSLFEKNTSDEEDYIADHFQQEVTTATNGTIKHFTVQKEQQYPDQDIFWAVTIKATALAQEEQQIHNKKFVIFPFQVETGTTNPNFSNHLQKSLQKRLSQTQKLIPKQSPSGKKINQGPKESFTRMGAKLGVDFIISGKINTIIQKKNTRTMRSTGKVFHNVTCGAKLSYQVFDIATNQIIFSNLYNQSQTHKGSNCTQTDIAKQVAASLGTQIADTISPARITAISDGMLTIEQGGNILKVGQELKIIQLEQTTVQRGPLSSSKGLEIGRAKIIEISNQHGKCTILKTNTDITQDFAKSWYIARTITKQKSKATEQQSYKKLKQETEADFKAFEKSSKDDW